MKRYTNPEALNETVSVCLSMTSIPIIIFYFDRANLQNGIIIFVEISAT
jgi:hypothetical protein